MRRGLGLARGPKTEGGLCGLSTPPERQKGIPKGLPFGAGSGVRNPSRVQGGSLGRRGPWGARAGGHELRWPAAGQEGAGDFIEPRVLLDSAGQLLHAEIDGAEGNALAVGVGAEPVQGARLATLAMLPDG